MLLLLLQYHTYSIFLPEISEKHFSTLETRMRISHIQSRTSRRERDFLSPNLMLRDKTENNFFQSQASRRDRDLFFFNLRLRDEIENFFKQFSVFETRTRINILLSLPEKSYFVQLFYTKIWWNFFTGPRCRCYTTCTLLFHLEAFQSIARQCCGFSPVLSPESQKLKI